MTKAGHMDRPTKSGKGGNPAGRLSRKEAYSMDEIVRRFIDEMKLASGLNRQRIFDAWDQASGAARYTSGKYLKNNVLYCSITSSVVRNRLFLQKTRILELMNDFLMKDELFVREEGKRVFVKDIVLR